MTAEPLAYELSGPTDGMLAHEHLVGGEQAFAELYRRYYPRLVRLCTRRTGDAHLAEDIAQETLVRALRYLGGFDTTRPMWPWLKTIATRIAYQHAQKCQLERCSDFDQEDPESYAVDSPCQQVDDQLVLTAALDRVPARQRAALILRYVDDWSTADSARFAGMTVPAFEQLLFRARRRLGAEYLRVTDGRRTGLLGVPVVLVLLRRARAALRTRVDAAGTAGVATSGLMGLATVGLTVATAVAPPTSTPQFASDAFRRTHSSASAERFVAFERASSTTLAAGHRHGAGPGTAAAPESPGGADGTRRELDNELGPARTSGHIDENPMGGGGKTIDIQVEVDAGPARISFGYSYERSDEATINCYGVQCEVTPPPLRPVG